MLINIQFFSVQQAGRECLKRQLEIDEANLKDYDRPLLKFKRSKNPFTLASAYGFARTIIKGMLP